jgi:integrase/recombinase XerD
VRLDGKGGRVRDIPLGRTSAKALSVWVKLSPPPGLVFPSRVGSPLNYHNIDNDWHDLCREAGLRVGGFHVLRHTFATLYLQAGGDVLSLQAILGHSRLEMTSRYVTLDRAATAAKHARFSPMNQIK